MNRYLDSIEEEILLKSKLLKNDESINHLFIEFDKYYSSDLIKYLKAKNIQPLKDLSLIKNNFVSTNCNILKHEGCSLYTLDIILDENGFKYYAIFEKNKLITPFYLGNRQNLCAHLNLTHQKFTFNTNAISYDDIEKLIYKMVQNNNDNPYICNDIHELVKHDFDFDWFLKEYEPIVTSDAYA